MAAFGCDGCFYSGGVFGWRLVCSQRWHGFWAFRLDRWIATGSHSHMVIVARRSRFSQAMARFGLGFVGLSMVVSHKLEGGIEVTPFSFAMALMALASITVGTLYQKRFVKPCDVRTASSVQLMAAWVVTLPLAMMESEAIQWNHQMLYAMTWSVLCLTLGGSSLFYILIQRGAAASVTSLMYLVPPTTAVLALVLFGETMTFVTLLGILVTALGVSLVVRSPKIDR